MTATPHNGKEEDFQLFLALLDGDRFEGRFRDGVHAADASDLMRRMVKERLVKFDGKPLFPERIAYTVPYQLSDAEAGLYQAVTDYVREEFNRRLDFEDLDDAPDAEAERAQLEAATGERIAALEAVEPDRAKGQDAGLEAGRSAGHESRASVPQERDRSPEREMERTRAPKSVDRDLGL